MLLVPPPSLAEVRLVLTWDPDLVLGTPGSTWLCLYAEVFLPLMGGEGRFREDSPLAQTVGGIFGNSFLVCRNWRCSLVLSRLDLLGDLWD